MAKFHNYYVLCPLIDQKSFLGISPDKDRENTIVTLGRNIVNKYRLSDQKQLSGWTSRDHITSTVVYDSEQDSYVGIFINNTIKIWKEDDDNLDKVKKYKFSVNILRLIPREDQSSILVFANGNCAALPYAIENRKSYDSKSLIKDTEKIIDVQCYSYNSTEYICYVIKNNKDTYEIINCALRNELGDLDRSKLSKVKVSRTDDVHVIGQLVCCDNNMLSVFILWSDAKLTMYDLVKRSWKTVGCVPWISTKTGVSLAKMGESHLIIFSNNKEQDGAIFVGYHVELGIGFCRYPMKMYSEGAKLYCVKDRIILEASNHIGVLPYALETERSLSSLLGSHEVIQDEITEVAEWETNTEPEFECPKNIKEYVKLGLTERNICTQVIPPLLEKNSDPDKIMTALKAFKDIPESVLVQILNYAIKKVGQENVNVTNPQEFLKFCKKGEKNQKFALLNDLFNIRFSDALLIPYLRNGFSLDNALFLLSYISFLLMESSLPLTTEYESKLFDWCILLMDAFYQQYLMTKDEKVTLVLANTTKVITTLVKQLSHVDNIMVRINKFLTKSHNENVESLPYSIEMMAI